jgi:hypothetical protein
VDTPLFIFTLFFEGDGHMAYQQQIGDKMPDGTVSPSISANPKKFVNAKSGRRGDHIFQVMLSTVQQ